MSLNFRSLLRLPRFLPPQTHAHVQTRGLLAQRAGGPLGEPDKSSAPYITAHTSPAPPDLQLLRQRTIERFPDQAHLMINEEQGRFLKMMVRASKARMVLELGCFTGYAAAWMSHGLVHADGKVITCETEKKHYDTAMEWKKDTHRGNAISILHSPAGDVLDAWNPEDKADFIFIDANKSGYINYLDTILKKNILSPDGLIIADNVLFRGLVAAQYMEETPRRLKGITRSIQDFNQHVLESPRVECVLLDTFDGLSLIQYKQGDE